MAKTNFTKVEEALAAGMHKISVENLLEITNRKQHKNPILAQKALEVKERHMFLIVIEQQLKFLSKNNPNIYKDFHIKKKYIQSMLLDPALITDEEWKKLQDLKLALNEYKNKLNASQPEATDEKLVDVSRKKHINKRFNINEKWLPLR
jgi:hypothetical protein